MSDVKIKIIDGKFTLGLENGDLVKDDGLETAVIISLFTDKRAKDDELPAGEETKRGWWADMFPEVDQDQIGSKLWLLQRSKRVNETLRKFEDYTREALNWLIEDGVAGSIEVSASYDENKWLVCDLDIIRPKGNTSRFQVFWDKQTVRAV